MALGKTLAYLAKMTSAQQKFAEGVATGLPAVRAYMVAYPKAKLPGAHASASKSLKNPKIASEIDRIRKRTQEVGGGAVLTLLEKRLFLAARSPRFRMILRSGNRSSIRKMGLSISCRTSSGRSSKTTIWPARAPSRRNRRLCLICWKGSEIVGDAQSIRHSHD